MTREEAAELTLEEVIKAIQVEMPTAFKPKAPKKKAAPKKKKAPAKKKPAAKKK
jgi:DNA topoisomerase-1